MKSSRIRFLWSFYGLRPQMHPERPNFLLAKTWALTVLTTSGSRLPPLPSLMLWYLATCPPDVNMKFSACYGYWPWVYLRNCLLQTRPPNKKETTTWLRKTPLLSVSSENESCSVESNSLRSHGIYSPWNSSGRNTGVGSLSLLQGIFPTQGLNPGPLHCKRILYQLSLKGSPSLSYPQPFTCGILNHLYHFFLFCSLILILAVNLLL